MGIKLKSNTIAQLLDLKHNSEGLITGDRNDPDNRIWVKDVEALDNAIEIIQDWLTVTNDDDVLDTIEIIRDWLTVINDDVLDAIEIIRDWLNVK